MARRTKRSARQVLARQVSEGAFQQQIITQATTLGWEAYHTHDSRRSQGGFPDTILIYPTPEATELAQPGRFEERLAEVETFPNVNMIVAELKKEDEYPKPNQRLWLALFRQITPHVYVWRPSDWPQIGEVLKTARPKGRGLHTLPNL